MKGGDWSSYDVKQVANDLDRRSHLFRRSENRYSSSTTEKEGVIATMRGILGM